MSDQTHDKPDLSFHEVGFGVSDAPITSGMPGYVIRSAEHFDMMSTIHQWLRNACYKHLLDDEVYLDASMYPMPTESGWEPSVFLYVMIKPVGDLDGMHFGEFISPYLINEEWVDYHVHQFAMDSETERKRVRDARAAGQKSNLGLPKDDDTV